MPIGVLMFTNDRSYTDGVIAVDEKERLNCYDVIARLKVLAILLADFIRFIGLLFVSHGSLVAENLFLRRQLALYSERGIKPRRALHHECSCATAFA